MPDRSIRGAIHRLADVVQMLGPLADQCVFVGGAALGLLLTDPAVPDVRPTLDVDVIAELLTRTDYYRFQVELRARGFSEDLESDVICRWRRDSVILDVMPTDPDILGFASKWYKPAFQSASELSVEGVRLRVVTPAYFLATKLEAFHGRGDGDYMASRDMEDVVALIDGRLDIVAEVAGADAEVRRYLAGQFSRLLADDDFLDVLPGHLPTDSASQARVQIVRRRMEEIAASA